MEMTDALKSALEIVKAQASARPMTEEEITSMVRNVAAGIEQIACGGYSGGGMVEPTAAPVVDPAKAIKERTIVCLESGKAFKVLTKKHLAKFGLTPDEYRAKYGYKKGTPLCAKSLQRERRKKMTEMKLWERRGKPAVEGEKA